MLLRVSSTSPVPLYEQIADQLRDAIADGSLAPGDRLVPAKELADGLGINIHTVLRAYGELRAEGLLDVRRRAGAVVAAGDDKALLRGLATTLVARGRHSGLTKREILRLVEDCFG